MAKIWAENCTKTFVFVNFESFFGLLFRLRSMKFQFFGVVRSEIQSYIIFEIFGSLGHFWPELWAENDENCAFAQNGAPVRGPNGSRVDGFSIFWARWIRY